MYLFAGSEGIGIGWCPTPARVDVNGHSWDFYGELKQVCFVYVDMLTFVSLSLVRTHELGIRVVGIDLGHYRRGEPCVPWRIPSGRVAY